MSTKHKHKFGIWYWQNPNICFGCDCGEKIVRKMTKEELKRQRGTLRSSGKNDVHQVWYKLMEELGEDWETEKDQGKKLIHGGICKRFSERKKYSDRVHFLRCDDSVFASSNLVLITHEALETWMGVSVLMFPQCDGKEPANFFLYPDHVDALINTLTKIQKHQRQVSKQQDRRERKDTKWWKVIARKEKKGT